MLAPRLGKAAAKQVLGDASARAAAAARPLAEVLAELPRVAEVFTRKELEALLDPAAYTGAAAALVDRALAAGPLAPGPAVDLGHPSAPRTRGRT